MSSNLAQQYVVHLDSIIKMYDDAYQEGNIHIPERVAYGIIARARGAVEQITGRRSSYTRQMLSILDEEWHPSYKAELITGIVAALKGDLQDGYLASLSELVHGEVFGDFLQMAEYLLNEGFKDAAAVIAGSTLEAHLRQLCLKHGVDIEHTLPDGSKRPKKASQLNQDLAKVAYSQFDQKQVTAWLDLRNSAAHGKYADYTDKQVEQFTEWLRHFIERNPA